ncbi:hypothetical protein HK103_005183 [Boothiomyces macroporosus]|uniref:Long-chain-alcohol oxidase n=1 Tax=Boothiomyces macroporosus TaxID=261099 RepID=A0AAD5UG32_9FUNG|nr:hypothetical protein HK103_005183 [Boothiomyces macroporosus]
MQKSAIASVLEAIADTFIAELNPQEISENEAAYMNAIDPKLHVDKAYREILFKFKPSSHLKNAGSVIEEYMNRVIPKDKLAAINFILSSLSTSLGTYIISGGVGLKPFPDMTREDREKVLLALGNSYLSDLRLLFRIFRLVSILHSYGTFDENKHNRAWDALKYHGPVKEMELNANLASKVWRPQFLNIDDLLNSQKEAVLECDVVVVGSGCGGGVMAAELAQAGYNVIMVEKGPYAHPSEYSLEEKTSFSENFEKEGGYYSEDGGILVLAGRTFGGGSTINWSASLELPEITRKEWSEKWGLPHFVTPEFQKSVDIASARIGVVQPDKHNVPNSLFFEGCKKLGYHITAIPQNTGGQEHQCGFCTFGCPNGGKKSSTITWIKDAAEAGCKFISNVEVQQVLHKNGNATGILAVKNGKPVRINSKKVVLSAGSMNTPVILLKSKIPGLSPHVGKHLHVHPVTTVFGIFPDRDVLAYKGSIMTTLSNQVANVDGQGYGARLGNNMSKPEIPASHPSIFTGAQKWESSKGHKRTILNWPHTVPVIVLTRDKDSEGQIYIDGENNGRLNWSLGKTDKINMAKGFEVGLNALIAAGAAEVYTTQSDVAPFKRNPALTPEQTLASKEYKEFLKKVEQSGVNTEKMTIFSAHQMSTCRMAGKKADGAVKPNGELYDLKGVYVADASVFPTASGVK